MSQYPYPPYYTPPGWPGWMVSPASGAAGVWQMVLGGLLLVLGILCLCMFGWLAPDSMMMDLVRQQNRPLPEVPGWSAAQIVRFTYCAMGVLVMGTGAALLLMAFFVRRGGRASTFCSIILNSVVGIVLFLNLANGVRMLAVNPARSALALVFCGGLLALCVATIVKLLSAYRASGDMRDAAMQQAQYWMMQQQAGGEGGYGYGSPPPPAPKLPDIPADGKHG